jgi:hypothetical protein
MKTQWTDQDIERVLRDLKDKPTGEAFWKGRVWDGIVAGLPEAPRARLVPVWYKRPGFLRWGLAAACLLAVMGGWQFQLRQSDSEMAEYVEEMSAPMDTQTAEQDHQWAPDLFRAPADETTDADESATYLEAVFDNA